MLGGLLGGAALLRAAREGGVSAALGDSGTDFAVGGLMLLLGFWALVWFCCCADRAEAAAGCAEVASEAVFTMPSALLLLPLLQAASKGALLCVVLQDLFWLLSMGKISSSKLIIYGEEVGGLSRSFAWTGAEKGMLFGYAFGSCWLLEAWSALGDFVVSYCAALWFFCPKDPETGAKEPPRGGIPLTRALCVGLGFHLGTLVTGGLLIGLSRLLRAPLALLKRQARGGKNPVARCLAEALGCCLECYDSSLGPLAPQAYIDVAIRSTHFCAAGHHWFSTMAAEVGGGVESLEGASGMFGVVCTTLIGGIGGSFAYAMAVTQECFVDPAGAWYIPDPVFLALTAGLISLVVGHAFMSVLVQAADCLLYCFVCDRNYPTLDQSGQRIEFPSDALQSLVAFHSS